MDRDEPLDVIVGATIPNVSGRLLTVSWPFLRLDIPADELVINFRSSVIRRMARFDSYVPKGDAGNAMTFWRTRKDDIKGIRMAGQSVLIYSSTGDCWIGIPLFVPSGHRIWRSIRAEVIALEAPIEFVTGNLRAARSMR
jgi:hypothetical protein